MNASRIATLQAKYEEALAICHAAEMAHVRAATKAKQARSALEDALRDTRTTTPCPGH
jgi:hypothetical protein